MTFPTFVYKPGSGPGRYKRKLYQYRAVEDEAQRQLMLKEGWLATRDEACGFAKPAQKPVDKPIEVKVEVAEDAPPTRAELEQKAKELGLKFDGRTPDRKLLKMIEES
jgi:hypothetical protein